MTNLPWSERQRTALRELTEQAAARARAEVETAAAFRAGTEAVEKEYHQLSERLHHQFQHAQAGADRKFQETKERVTLQFEAEHHAASQEYSGVTHKASYLYSLAKEKIETEFKETRWTISTIYDSDKKAAKEQLATTQTKIEGTLAKVKETHQQAFRLLIDWKMADLIPVTVEPQAEGDEDPFKALQKCSLEAGNRLAALQALKVPKFLKGQRFTFLSLLAWALATAPAVFFPAWHYWVLGSSASAVVAFVLGHAWLKHAGRRQAAALFQPLCQTLADARALRKRCLDIARATYKEQRAASKKTNQEALKQAFRRCRDLLKEVTRQRDDELARAEQTYPPRLAELENYRSAELHQAETLQQLHIADLTARYEEELGLLNEKFGRLRDGINRKHANDWTRLAEAWKQACDRFVQVAGEVDQQCHPRFPPWTDPTWENWQPPACVPLGIRFGELDLKPERIPHGIPQDAQLTRLSLGDLNFPALLAFPERASLLVEAGEEGRGPADAALQAVMLRFLTALPPGKGRFTILDPLGRGEPFAAFMHLADHDELLVTSRIWTEPAHIDERLADLTEHMENVLQKYLRNQFQTLEEYNVQAGEVAEPYRLLVVANFPHNFSPASARRLLSLAASGARCGIYTLISLDTRQALPQGFSLADLERACLTLIWRDQKFLWNDVDFAGYPLTVDKPPAAELCTRLMHVIGEEAKRASRVEVPFEFVAPPPEAWWTGDSRAGLSVALGRAGALQRQFLSLGQGTAQHALVAGKTGSGKSTLLHALITQLALQYSPDEVELYLIDFKKGVEFKTYASHALPHARVIAVESEREFGLSVLQRLDAELKLRGERFRQLGVTDLNAFRELAPPASGGRQPPDVDTPARTESSGGLRPPLAGEPMPRIVLIVDEFQEFFVEDDKIAQEAALLLDRLVRQGRAFGMHILLGSQTLGGAYSLARSTIDQMAVRIALQCSEADAHLILSKDNSAARLLTRPGEAIYNAANGLLEGNNLFQVVWLPDERRDDYLRRIHELARERNGMPAPPPIVFEGMAPAELPKNPLLERWLNDGPPAVPPPVWTAWLGEAIAIKDPTAAVFRKQSSANLLLVGQQAEAAFNVLASAACSLAAQLVPQEKPSLFFVPGSPPEGLAETFLTHLSEALAAYLKIVAIRDLSTLLVELGDELDRRLQGTGGGEPCFLFLYGLHRLRDLRRDEDFGFARRGEDKGPAKRFGDLLRDGPPVGLFTLAWCDNLNNLNRTLDRTQLREFDLRVLFQMSAADSSNLIDSPLAAKLGMHRALYATEDEGRLEKFRPYGLPPADWLISQFAARKGLPV